MTSPDEAYLRFLITNAIRHRYLKVRFTGGSVIEPAYWLKVGLPKNPTAISRSIIWSLVDSITALLGKEKRWFFEAVRE